MKSSFCSLDSKIHIELLHRDCHNHLKQPWKIGEPPTSPRNNTFQSLGLIFPCNKILMVDPASSTSSGATWAMEQVNTLPETSSLSPWNLMVPWKMIRLPALGRGVSAYFHGDSYPVTSKSMGDTEMLADSTARINAQDETGNNKETQIVMR